MNKAIISGATGFVGTHLCQELIKNGVSVYALCRKNSPNIHRLPKETHIVECSMNDYANLNFDFEKADVFYHLAWEGATGKERANETIQSENARNTLEAVSTAKRIGCKKLVAVGTVYENFYEQVISRDNFNSADFYILSKVYAHRMAEKLASKIGIDFLWCTFFHPIGKYNNLNQMMAYAVKGMLDGNSPSFGSAEQPYDITAVENIALGLYLAGKNNVSRKEYYIGGGNPKIMKDYLYEARNVLGVDTKLLIGERPDDGLRFNFDWYDISAFAAETGYKPYVSFPQAVKNLSEWVSSMQA